MLALALGFRLWGLASVCLDGDEIFSLLVGRHGWQDLTGAVAADSVHPPLFYYLLHMWLAIGNESLIWLRLLPATISMAALFPLVLFCFELRLRPREINTVIGIAAIHPYLIYYSQHLRMYSLLMLLGFTSLWLFGKVVNGLPETHSAFAAFTIVNIAMVYSHYYGWVLVAMECGYLIIQRRTHLRRASLSLLAVGACFLPWAWLVIRAVKAKGGLGTNLDWIPRPNLLALIWFFIDLAGCAEFRAFGVLLAMGFGGVIIAAVWSQKAKSRKTSSTLLFLGAFFLVPIALSFLASWALPESVWGHRHLVFVAAPFFAFCSIAFWRARGRVVRACIQLCSVLWVGQALCHEIGSDDKKLPWDKLVVEVVAREPVLTMPVRFYSLDRYLHYPVWFYLEGLKARIPPGFAVSFKPGDREALALHAGFVDVKQAASVDDLNGEHFWVGYSSTSWQQQDIERLLINRGCTTGPAVTARDRFHEVATLPAWCSSAAAR